MSMYTAKDSNKPCLILLDKSDFHMIDNLLIGDITSKVYADMSFSRWELVDKF